MKILHTLSWTIAVTFLVAGAVAAQGPLMAPVGEFRGVWTPVVGSGATYEVETPKGAKSEIGMAVVGQEDVAGKTGYWIEMAMAGGQMYTKTLTVVDGKNALVTRTIMQMPGMGPMEMPALAGQGTQSTPTDIRDTADKIGTESVTTPGGTFDCDHYRAKDGSWDEWISAQVSPWGLVKLTSTRFGTITVSKVVTDAKDHITGTPQPFDPKQMGRGRQQP